MNSILAQLTYLQYRMAITRDNILTATGNTYLPVGSAGVFNYILRKKGKSCRKLFCHLHPLVQQAICDRMRKLMKGNREQMEMGSG